MKDSDDYITARGANPRTGLISPSASAGTLSSRSPEYSDGEVVIRLRHCYPRSRSRSTAMSASSGPHIGPRYDSSRCHCAGEDEGLEHQAGTGETRSRYGFFSVLKDDQFIVRMPSAQEPQPFAYPGYSAEQIEALEQYEQKKNNPRRSSDECCRRGVDNFGNVSPSHPIRHHTAHITTRPHQKITSHAPPVHLQDEPDGGPSRAVLSPIPRNICMKKTRGKGKYPVSAPALDVNRESQPQVTAQKWTNIPRKPIDRATTSNQGGKLQNTLEEELENPPRVHYITLVHHRQAPTFPREEYVEHPISKHHHQSESTDDRKRSYHPREQDFASDSNTNTNTTMASAQESGAIAEASETTTAIGTDPISIIFNLFFNNNTLSPQIPHSFLSDLLAAEWISPQQKLSALRTLLRTGGRILTLCIVIALAWRFGAAVIRVLDEIWWPVIVPFRLVAWVCGKVFS